MGKGARSGRGGSRSRGGGATAAGGRLGAILLILFLLLLALSLALRYGPGLGGWWQERGAGAQRSGEEAGGRNQSGDPAPAPASDAEAAAPPTEAGPRALRLQILNATGQHKLALATGEKLRRWNVDTLDRANAPPWPFPETLLLVRSGRGEAVRKLARRLGGVPVIVQRREDLMLDATLLLGHDWESYRWPD